VIVAPDTCPDCGARVVPTAKPGRTRRAKGGGRTRRAKGGGRMAIPETLCIPTCTRCDAEWMDEATARALAALDNP
jgi:hypothetical protein